jgi:N6-adenosine-specific RNA methylase IME4
MCAACSAQRKGKSQMSQPAIWSKGPLSLHRRHLEVVGKQQPTRTQLKDAARNILTFRDSGAWGIGDLIVIASALGAEDPVNEVIESLVRDRQMARKCFYVAKSIGVDDRVFDLWWNFYFAVYTFPADARNRLLKLAEEQHWTLDEFKKHLRDLRHNIRSDAQSFPEGQYGLLYVDPPWKYDDNSIDPTRRIENQYPTMDVDEIRTFADVDGRTVEDLAAKNSILYLWSTVPKLEEALSVMQAWGFEYRSGAVWVKDIPGMGYFFRQRHELLLVGVKGEPVLPAEDVRRDSVFEFPRSSEHSKKPDAVYSMLDEQYPKVPKIEIFARTERPDWVSWGNQISAAQEVQAVETAKTNDDVVTDSDEEQRKREAEKKKAPRLVKKGHGARSAAAAV